MEDDDRILNDAISAVHAACAIKPSVHEPSFEVKEAEPDVVDTVKNDKKDYEDSRKVDSGSSAGASTQRLCTLICQKLDELVSGDLVEESGLTERDYHLLLSHDVTFVAFINLLGKSLSRIEAATNPQFRFPKKFMKLKERKHIEAVESNSCLVREQIKAHQNVFACSQHNECEKKRKRLNSDESETQPEREMSNKKVRVMESAGADRVGIKEEESEDEVEFVGTNIDSGVQDNWAIIRKSRQYDKKIINHAPSESTIEEEQKLLVRKGDDIHHKVTMSSIGNNNARSYDDTSESSADKLQDDISQDASNINEGDEKNETFEGLQSTNHAKVGGVSIFPDLNLCSDVNNTATDCNEVWDMDMTGLNELDTVLKDNFREVGFAKWTGGWQPIIQLSPFDVPSAAVRNKWLNIFKKVKIMPRLVYWYGTPHWDNLSCAFSFVHQSDILTYNEGVTMGLNILPKPPNKIGAKMNEYEEFLYAGLEEQKNELTLPKDKRVAWLKQSQVNEYLPINDDSTHEQIPLRQPDAVSSNVFHEVINVCSSTPLPTHYYPLDQGEVFNANHISDMTGPTQNGTTALCGTMNNFVNNGESENCVSSDFSIREQKACKVENTLKLSSNVITEHDYIERQTLLSFLQSQKTCVKGSPKAFFNWLVNFEDILSLDDLFDALSDEDYVRGPLQLGDGQCGLKGFKRNKFKRALEVLVKNGT